MTPTEIFRLLPDVIRRAASRDDPLDTLVGVMSAMHTPTVETLDRLDEAFDPQRADEDLVRMLAYWVGVDPNDGVSTAATRALVARAAVLSRYRGTAWALVQHLEVATDVRGFVVREPEDQPFHLVVEVPTAAAGQVERVRRIVAREKPAYATFEVVEVER
ncbi:MAG: phage tail protein [Deltaproteobacteria bacterium]|jgi:phage tail-like protein